MTCARLGFCSSNNFAKIILAKLQKNECRWHPSFIGLYLVTKKFDVQMMESRFVCGRDVVAFFTRPRIVCPRVCISTLSAPKPQAGNKIFVCVRFSNTDFFCIYGARGTKSRQHAGCIQTLFGFRGKVLCVGEEFQA